MSLLAGVFSWTANFRQLLKNTNRRWISQNAAICNGALNLRVVVCLSNQKNIWFMCLDTPSWISDFNFCVLTTICSQTKFTLCFYQKKKHIFLVNSLEHLIEEGKMFPDCTIPSAGLGGHIHFHAFSVYSIIFCSYFLVLSR